MNRLFVFALAFIAAATATFATQTRVQTMFQTPFGGGEELIYNVSYRARLIPPINLMKVSLRTFGETFGGKAHYHVVGNGKTTGVAGGVFTLNDTYHTWLDAATLLPSRMTSDLNENDYRLVATYNYDWNSLVATNTIRKASWSEDRLAAVPLTDKSGDAISLFFRLRAIDPASLVPGKAYPLDLVLNETSRAISYTFLGREEVKLKKTGTFRALKFTCTMATSDGSTYEDGMSFTVWVSDDANHIPLLVESPVRVGRVVVTLAGGYRVIHPLSSLVK